MLHVPFCSEMPFLLYPDWNLKTYVGNFDMTSVDANTFAKRLILSHVYIAVRPKFLLKIMTSNVTWKEITAKRLCILLFYTRNF